MPLGRTWQSQARECCDRACAHVHISLAKWFQICNHSMQWKPATTRPRPEDRGETASSATPRRGDAPLHERRRRTAIRAIDESGLTFTQMKVADDARRPGRGRRASRQAGRRGPRALAAVGEPRGRRARQAGWSPAPRTRPTAACACSPHRRRAGARRPAHGRAPRGLGPFAASLTDESAAARRRRSSCCSSATRSQTSTGTTEGRQHR